MPKRDNVYNKLLIKNIIDNTVITHPDAVAIAAF
ncbi:MAG: hypothetical protein JWR02_432 [Mucilaginibacter sp.]|nr:hypothetical protein [Mucilaginibacter sp.]